MTKRRETATFYGAVNEKGRWVKDAELGATGARHGTLAQAIIYATRRLALECCREGEKPRAVRVTPLTVENKARTR